MGRLHQRLNTDGERGAALLLALVFIGVIALVISALLAQSVTQFKAARAFREQREGVFAADAGLEHAIAGAGMLQGTSEPGECAAPETIALIARSTAKHDGVNSLSLSLPLVDGSHRMLLVAVSHQGNKSVAGITFGGMPLTRLHRESIGSGNSGNTIEVWFLPEDRGFPTAANPSVVMTASDRDDFAMHASLWAGVEQAAPAFEHDQAWDSSSITTTVATRTGHLVYSAASTSDGRTSIATGGAGTRLAGGSSSENPTSASMSTSYRVSTADGGAAVTETFHERRVEPGTHILVSAAPGQTTGPCPDETLQPTLVNEAVAVDWEPATLSNFAITKPAGWNRVLIVTVGVGRLAIGSVPLGAGAITVTGAGGFSAEIPSSRRVSRQIQECSVFGAVCWGTSTEIWYLFDDELPAASQPVTIEVSGSATQYAVHASLWTGVLQRETEGGPHYAPQHWSNAAANEDIAAITTDVLPSFGSSLVFSAAGHFNDDFDWPTCRDDPNLTGVGAGNRISGDESDDHPSCGSLGTSYTVIGEAPSAPIPVTETFAESSRWTAQVVVAFRPASWAPVELLAACAVPDGIDLPGSYNGYSVHVDCTITDSYPDPPGPDTLRIVSTASNGQRTATARATETRLPDSSLQITEWDTRPSAEP